MDSAAAQIPESKPPRAPDLGLNKWHRYRALEIAVQIRRGYAG